jgi:hypothetical protein
VLWLVISSARILVIFVSIQEKSAKIGAVKTVFVPVEYATVLQDILERTAQKPPVQLTSISIQPITLVEQAAPQVPTKTFSQKLAFHAILHVITVSMNPPFAAHVIRQLKTLKSFTTFSVIANVPLVPIKSATSATIATIPQPTVKLVLEHQPIVRAA